MLLGDFCRAAEQRDAYRHTQLASNDISLRTPPIDYALRFQVLAEAQQLLRHGVTTFDVPEPDTQHECSICHMVFLNLAAL